MSNALVRNHSDILRGIYNLKQEGALGDSVTDDTARVQACFTAASTSVQGAAGTVYVPPGIYKLTSSILLSVNAAQYLNIVSDGPYGSAVFQWAGATNTPMFLIKGWKTSQIENIVCRTGNIAGVVCWDIDVNATQTSAGFLTFTNCTVEFGTGTACIGWRGSIGTLGDGDVSFVNFNNCHANGVNRSYLDIGWLGLRNNVLVWNWYGGASYGVGTSFSNFRPGGGESGGGSMHWYGFGTAGCGVDFDFATAGNYLISGGRFETGKKFLQSGASGATGSHAILISGVEISSYTPADNKVINLQSSTQLVIDCSQIIGPGLSDYTAAMLSIENTAAVYGSVRISNSVLQAADPFYTVTGGTGTWHVQVKNCTRRPTGSAAPTGFYANADT